jgi:hypothetical protein
MKKFNLILIFVLGLIFNLSAQVKVHSHNDYTRQNPFYDAVKEKMFSLEADVFLINDTLFVAHTKKEINPEATLEKLYLKPIAGLSKTKNFYNFNLLIDVKESWQQTAPTLLKLLDKYSKFFKTSKTQVNIIITGNRPADSLYHTFPEYIKFDGLPTESYKPIDLEKVAMVSVSFKKYAIWKGVGEISMEEENKLKEVINSTHKLNKPIRFWSAPDNKEAWVYLRKLGVDIINTDKIKECVQYFKSINEL